MGAAMKLNSSLVRRASSSIIPTNRSAIFPRQFLRAPQLLPILRFCSSITTVVDYNTNYNIGSLRPLVFVRRNYALAMGKVTT
ncbi:hypothetical protein M5689_010528 [Euphorbia peplus]|nr:hypothetical protein M5689_010528 [Euphorbia peplus]